MHSPNSSYQVISKKTNPYTNHNPHISKSKISKKQKIQFLVIFVQKTLLTLNISNYSQKKEKNKKPPLKNPNTFTITKTIHSPRFFQIQNSSTHSKRETTIPSPLYSLEIVFTKKKKEKNNPKHQDSWNLRTNKSLVKHQ